NSVGYKWKPTERTFTLVGKVFPLTRITTNNKVPLRVPIPLEVVAPEHVVTRVYTKRPKVPKSVPNSKPKDTKSMTANRIEPDTSRGFDTLVVQIVLWYLDSECSKHMTGDRSQLTYFVHKFLGTVKFDNDQVMKIMGSCANSTKNGVVERRNRTLVEAARTMLIYAKDPLFLWAEAVATACYTQNRSIIGHCHGKTPYELLHDKKPDLSYLYVFGALCYPNNDSENLGKLQAKADIGIFIGYTPKKKAYRIYNRRSQKIIETIHVDFDELTAMAFEQSSLEPAFHEMTPVTPNSGLVPNPPPIALFVPPSRHEWDLVFQPVFDEFFSLPASVASHVPIEEAHAPVESTGSPSSTTV
nr:retrovirus-related Pol polyprotein from transposon TNT 1-94 [Tanacetum cinerariifolium]